MPKLKTKKAVSKRVSVTGTGKLKKTKANKQHILTKKSTKRKRGLRKANLVDKSNMKQMKKVLPYI
ncbi:MAG: 50S ribosomal protein L35 [Eubacteriales bacterium]|uniref:50S ribosomal protein L35 n=1 Tax=uncultured Tyzzerella sp. TaxID=2321398 RepID=UPI001D7E9061|nr:50S ribosomal protein L35 [uncultured Tyzzerella sp.]MBS5793177.1 50S ribosomal protein L35 [Clostridiales bacterium]MDE6182631.1 50S ribosomal protein L35 [Eubacteriales bacterium]MDE6357819.1 50S ribosomal protein L35 [Eubacteriales bacterium]